MSTTSVDGSATVSYSQERSGLSAEEVVEVKVQQRLDRADAIDAQITENETLISAYEYTQDSLQTLLDALDALNDPADDSNVFEDRVTELGSSSGTDPETLLSATIDDGVDVGEHEVEIIQVAKAQRIGGSYQSSRSAELGLDGTLTLGTEGTGSADVAITSDMSLEEIRDAINDVTGDTGVKASIITVSDTEYMLVLTTADTNQEVQLAGGADTAIAEGLGLLDGSGAYANELQAAQPAILSVDGVAGLERDSNDIDDIIDGVTLHLLKAEEGTTITIGIEQDTEAIQAAIEAFVDAYNAWRDWVAQNQGSNSDGTAAADAYLFGDTALRSVSTSLGSIIGNMVGGHSLGEFGITMNADNQLEIDTDTLADALADDLSSVQSLFEYAADTSSSELSLHSHDGSSFSGSFTLEITVDGNGDPVAAAVGGDASLFTVSGSKILGAEGSVYEGLEFKFTGDASATVTVTIRQGLADQLHQVADAAANGETGTLQGLIDAIETRDTELASESDRIRTRAEEYRSYLLDYYGRIEAKISAAQIMIDVLEALTASSSD